MAGALRAGHARRRAAPVARPLARRRRWSTRARSRQTEGYSGFEATNLADLLRERDVDHVTLVGLATDYCVKHTALDALRHGFGVTVDSTAVRPVEVQPGDGERALEEVRAAGARSPSGWRQAPLLAG